MTGASSGLGVPFATALARQGADIAICARRVEKLEKVKADIEALGVKCYAHKCDATWRRVLSTNLDAVYYMAREVGSDMLKNGYGKIINIGSVHSEVAMSPNCFPVAEYAAAKGGVKMLTEALAVEWAQKGITVNAIGPAYFASEMTSAAISDDDGALIYFASDASSYTTGQLLYVDGGWTAG